MPSFMNTLELKIFILLYIFTVIFCTVLSESVDFSGCLTSEPELPPPCASQIYCQGPILHDVQLARVYNDSKTFVDKKLKYPESFILQKYEELRTSIGSSPTKEELEQFVDEYFEDGNELETCTPCEYNEDFPLIEKIVNPGYKEWARDLNEIFLNLTRQAKPEVNQNPDLYSFLYVPNCFVIPGGRFTELYYWDTYWIVNGVLLTGMPQLARGIIENFVYIFRKYGIIPNGSRNYYLQRSQPPLLCFMFLAYWEYTNDTDFVRKNIDVLDEEYRYWTKNQMVDVMKDGVGYKMFRYYAPSSGPRPESYREDYVTAENITDENQKNRLYINLKSAAESGHDFSTRWIIKCGTNEGALSDTQTMNIVPVDLNAFMQNNAKILRYFYYILGDSTKSKKYNLRAESLQRAIDAVLWRPDRGIWLDFDVKNNESRDYFYVTNFTPLWTGSYSDTIENTAKAVIKYFRESGTGAYIGGVPTSKINSTLQWDFPNAWPPLQAILVQGIDGLGTPEAKQLASCLAEKWLRTNYEGYRKYDTMFEKYDVTTVGDTGGGGEYAAQKGFGWTNGVALQFLDQYPNSSPEEADDCCS